LVLGARIPLPALVKLVDAYTEEAVLKADGKVTLTRHTATVSRDERTMTVICKGKNAQGQLVNNVRVFER